jgi:Asp-tRNA(Asn)/Glu-tRNA(Gln) amidotransferase A subunit family amidase
MKDICYLSATELAERIRTGDLSPVEVVDMHLKRIDEINDQVNAFVHVDEDAARTKAQEAERTINSGAEVGRLHGVPVAIKDFLGFKKGMPNTFGGSLLFEDHISDTTAVFVERLEAEGAIVLGKTNSPEFALGPVTDNPLHGPTGNPFDLQKTAGGSSGGSAAAVCAGLTPLAQGSDAGGSIRIPSAFTGVYGLKPTFGQIPVVHTGRPDGFIHYKPYFHFGPITRTVEDAALMFDIMAGMDSRDPFTVPQSDNNYVKATEQSISEMEIAYSPDLGTYPVSQEVRAVIEDAVTSFEDAGASVSEIQVDLGRSQQEILDAFYQWAQVTWKSVLSGLADKYDVDPLGQDKEKLNNKLQELVFEGEDIKATEYKQTDVLRTDVLDAVESLFEEWDILLTPTSAVPAFDYDSRGPSKIDGEQIEPARGWVLTQPFNMSGHPAASMPVGQTEEGLPVGLQVVGPRFGEEAIFAASAAFERQNPWHPSYSDI